MNPLLVLIFALPVSNLGVVARNPSMDKTASSVVPDTGPLFQLAQSVDTLRRELNWTEEPMSETWLVNQSRYESTSYSDSSMSPSDVVPAVASYALHYATLPQGVISASVSRVTTEILPTTYPGATPGPSESTILAPESKDGTVLSPEANLEGKPVAPGATSKTVDSPGPAQGLLDYQGALVPLIYAVTKPLQVRILKIYAVAAYEAWATYDPKASGVVFGKTLKRSPEQQANETAKQTTINYSIFRTLETLYPVLRPEFFNITYGLGLDPLDTNNDTCTAVGLGNYIAYALINKFLRDEFNQPGLFNGDGLAENNRIPYLDYSHYEPVNTAYQLKDPTRWQPELVTDGNGNFWSTTFSQPFWGLPLITTTFAVKSSTEFRVPPPENSKTFGSPNYCAQADTVLNYSAELNDYRKMLAEFFHDPVQTTGFPEIFLANVYGWGLDELVKWNFITANGLYDGDSTVWFYKRFYDSVRPSSVIQNSGLYKRIVAWGGPGKGTVSMDAQDWRPYLVNRPSTEYPSGVSCGCAVIAEAGRRFLGTDDFGLTLLSPPGISYVEPGLTPAEPVILSFPTFTEFENKCAEARVIGGVNFPAATAEGKRICDWATSLVFDKAQLYFNGDAE